MQIVDHKLCGDDGSEYPFVPSPNIGGLLKPEYLVIHYTAGGSAEGAIAWLSNPEAQVSAHLVIGRDGRITQLVPFDRIAWHAGRSAWQGRTGLNQHSIGIELDNAGRLTPSGNRWKAWFGTEYEADEVTEATHMNEDTSCGWHIYPHSQLGVLWEVGRTLVDTYSLHDVLGHDDIAPDRKSDPGPAFPMSGLRAYLFP